MPTVAKLKTRIEEAPPAAGKLSGLPSVVPLPEPSSEVILKLMRLPGLAPERFKVPVTLSLS